MKTEILGKNGIKTVNLNRRRAIRERCLNCSAWVLKEVEQCSFATACPLWPFRMGRGRQDAKARNKALRAYCVWCMAGDVFEVKRCVSSHCALFLFRTASAQKSPLVSKKAHLDAISEANKGNEWQWSLEAPMGALTHAGGV